MHDHEPDLVNCIMGDAPLNVILETERCDPLKDVKHEAAKRLGLSSEIVSASGLAI